MNWSRVRWYLIICLVLADALLLGMLFHQYRGENTIGRASLEDIAAMLADAGILLDADTVPTATAHNNVYRVPVTDELYKQALERMVGSAVTGTYLLPLSGGMSVVFENSDRAEYFKNLYVTYDRYGDTRSAQDWDDMISAFLGGDIGYQPIPGRVQTSAIRDAADIAASFLAHLTGDDGGTLTGASVSLRPRTEAIYTTPFHDVYLVELRETLSRGSGKRTQSDIHGTVMYVFVEGGSVRYLAGTWVPFLPDGTYDTDTLDQINILFSEMRRYTAQRTAETDGVGDGITLETEENRAQICEMERMYYMLWDESGGLYLRPAWRFLYAFGDGATIKAEQEILCDAVTGNVVRQADIRSDYGENVNK